MATTLLQKYMMLHTPCVVLSRNNYAYLSILYNKEDNTEEMKKISSEKMTIL